MSATLACDQAIFTSIRNPLGEGYRIVSASRHLHPDEKQAITRQSPSHDALCDEESDKNVVGAAFYALPGGRLCVAYSCCAGAEHTGRGGQRVYTHNVVFKPDDFACCAYNPFVILRAMTECGLTTPQIPPPRELDELALTISDQALAVPDSVAATALSSDWRKHCLNALLNDRTLLINQSQRWIDTAEALVLGLPGPARSTLSFSAGLRFSVGRCHRLSLTADNPITTKKRIEGRSIEYIEPSKEAAPESQTSSWITFVERHWERGDLQRLASRTSLPFEDASVEARERIGRLYGQLDALPDSTTTDILKLAPRHLQHPIPPVESDIAAELLVQAQETLRGRFRCETWVQLEPNIDPLCSIWRQSEDGTLFGWPLLEVLVEIAERQHPTIAAEVALKLTRDIPSGMDASEHARMLDRVLTRLANFADQAGDEELLPLPTLVQRWQTVRPNCPLVGRIQARCEALAAIQSEK